MIREALPLMDALGPVTITADADSSTLTIEADETDVARLGVLIGLLDRPPFQGGEPTLPLVVASALFPESENARQTVTLV